MKDAQLWQVFQETGDPRDYLRYRAQQSGEAARETKPGETKRQPPPGAAEAEM
ncbi:MAG: hypothetical protein IKS66_03830 [Oscillospiraceae bacterium]|nr:hypothetical protein [Oscillospiraceae bacterium]